MKEPRWGLLLLCGCVTAAHGAAVVIQERRVLMRGIAGDLRVIWDGLAREDSKVVEKAALWIAAQAARLPTLFPRDSFHPPSRAQPTIRQEFPAFEALAVALKRAAEELAASVRQATHLHVQANLEWLVQTCRRCHCSYIQRY